MKKVLMVSCGGLGIGGVQNVMMNIVRELSDDYSFDMLLFTDERRFFDSEMEEYGNIYRIPDKNSRIDYYIRFFRIFIKTYLLIKRNGYDVIHCNKSFESGICVLAAFLANVKVRIVHSHVIESMHDKNIVRKCIDLFYKFLINTFANKKIACSTESGKSLFGKGFSVIANPIDLKRFDISKRAPRTDGIIKFIHIGRFCETKNQLFVLRTIAEIRKEIENIIITFVGYGDSYEKILTEETEKNNLKDIVTILPADTDVAAEFADSDYMIFPSRNEGLGIALLEAQAMGVYCFASDGVPKEANAGLCEFLDLNTGVEAWAKRVVECIKNQETPGYAKNIDNYSIENICATVKNIYNS